MIAWLVLLQATLTISVAGPLTGPEYLPLRIAQAEGYFAQEKLDVSLLDTRAEPPAAEALGRARASLAATSLDAALQLGDAAGAPPRLVFGLTAAPPVVLLVPTGQRETVRSVADLAGKTVGIAAPGTPGALVLVSLLERADVRVHQVSIQSFGDRGVAGAVESGAVVAAVVDDPWATRLLEEGKAVALVDLRRRAEAARWLGGSTVHAAVFARADSRLGGAELVPLSRALLRGLTRVRDGRAEDLAARLPAAVVGAPDDFALRLAGARESFLPDGLVSADALAASLALVRARVAIPARVDIPRRAGRLLLMDPLTEALGRSR
jgi:NitT/TauT family transport system substrate-binding protein